MRKSLFLLFFCCFLSVSYGADSISSFLYRPVTDSYAHQDTGLVFPAFIGGFTKNRVTVNRNPAIGTTVRYVNKAGTCADVYLFTAEISEQQPVITAEKAGAVFETTCATILKLASSGTMITKSEKLSADELKIESGVPHRKAMFRIQTKTETLDSLLVMSYRRKHLIKIRVSWSVNAGEEKDGAVSFVNHILQLISNADLTEQTAKTAGNQPVKTEFPAAISEKGKPEDGKK